MKKLKIVADDKIPFLRGVLERFADVVYLPGSRISAADARDADAIFTRTRTKCNESLLKGSSVRLIATATIGFDHIDTDYCDSAGIRWINAPGCNSGSVQQYVTAALATLVYRRKLKFSDLTLGVVGVGNVGSKVCRAARALGMNVLLNDPPKEADNCGYVSLDELLAGSDIVTCHVPLNKTGAYPTFHLASDGFFDRMRDGAVFINSSRGAVADADALKRASQTKLSAYILDVWEGEPAPDAGLLEGAFIGTPHIAGYSSDGKANGTAACVREFCRFFGLDALAEWYPDSVPLPPMPVDFVLDGNGKSREQIIYEAVTHTYPVRDDSDRLKRSPSTFEEQRGAYWTRREFDCFTISPVDVDSGTLQSLESLGFKTAESRK
jgi:erythronate-4-phosphate dehydrogenase